MWLQEISEVSNLVLHWVRKLEFLAVSSCHPMSKLKGIGLIMVITEFFAMALWPCFVKKIFITQGLITMEKSYSFFRKISNWKKGQKQKRPQVCTPFLSQSLVPRAWAEGWHLWASAGNKFLGSGAGGREQPHLSCLWQIACRDWVGWGKGVGVGMCVAPGNRDSFSDGENREDKRMTGEILKNL